jgi:hypothetical protein
MSSSSIATRTGEVRLSIILSTLRVLTPPSEHKGPLRGNVRTQDDNYPQDPLTQGELMGDARVTVVVRS